jgi:hypothetical protein
MGYLGRIPRLFKGALMVSVLTLVVFMATFTGTTQPTFAQSGCNLLAAGPFNESVTGMFRLWASTEEVPPAGNPSACNWLNPYVQTWVSGRSLLGCDIGWLNEDRCKDEASPSNYFAASQAYTPGYGLANGLSLSKYHNTDNDSWVTIGDVRVTELNAGEPPSGGSGGECDEGYYWDESSEKCIPENCPIIVPTSKSQQIKLSSAEKGVLFDIDADGIVERVAWPENNGVAFLAIDRNNNGQIDNGSELFGNNTLPTAQNGFVALAQLDREMGGPVTGVLSAGSPLFEKLLLWTDVNRDGISQAHELQPAGALFSGVGLAYSDHHRKDGHGNVYRYDGFVQVRTAPGKNMPKSPEEDKARTIKVYDVFLVTK